MAIRRQRYHGARTRRLRPELLEHRLMLASDLMVDADWFGGSSGGAQLGGTESPAAATSRWMVQLTDQAVLQAGSAAAVPQLLAGVPLAGVRGLGLPGQLLVEATGTHSHIAASLAASPHVDSFQIDAHLGGAQVPNDPRFAQDQYALFNTGLDQGTFDADIDADLAWDLTTGSSEVVVAIIDSGIDYTHPDLNDNIWNSPGGILGPDGSTLVTNGWDFANDDDDPIDDHGHGTHVAGIVGAEGNNAIGTAGVNWDVSLLPIKLLDENNAGSVADAVEAINFATLLRTRDEVNIRVINASWGGVGIDNPMLEDAIQAAGDAGILFVAAAGNGDVFGRGQDLAVSPFFPASFDLDNVLSVGATDRNDLPTRFSNFGQAVDISAPGQSIWSTDLLVDSGAQIHSTRSGTSMAAPHVAGVAALAWDLAPNASLAEIREAIIAGGETKAALQGQTASQKRLNALGTLNALRPQAEVTTADDIDNDDLSDTTYQFTVTLTKPSGLNLDRTSIGDGDFFVRQQGETDELPVTLASPPPGANQPEYTGLDYQFTPPGGSWDPTDAGTYEIVLASGEVLDVNGGASAQKVVDTFEVSFTGAGVFRPTVFDDPIGSDLSLRSAVQDANDISGTGTIVLAPGTYILEIQGRGEDAAATGDLDITGNVTIASDGTGEVIIDATGIDRVFDVHAGASLTLDSVTVTGGGVSDNGGGIQNEGILVIAKSTVSGNVASSRGGAIFNKYGGQVDITDSTISTNSATGIDAIPILVPSGSEFRVNSSTNGPQSVPDVASNSSGLTAVAWESGATPPDQDVFVQVFESDGSALGGNTQGNLTSAAEKHSAAIAVAEDNSRVIAYSGTGADAGGTAVQARVFDGTTGTPSVEISVNFQQFGNQFDPIVRTFGSEFLVAFNTDHDSETNVLARRFDLNGNALGGEFLVNEETAGVESEFVDDIAYWDDGSFVASWRSIGRSSDFIRIFDSDETPLTGEIAVNTSKVNSGSGTAIYTRTDGFVAVWQSGATTLRGRKFDLLGNPDGADFIITNEASGEQLPSVAPMPDGGFVIAWVGPTEGGGNSDIYYRQFSGAMQPVGIAQVINQTTAGEQANPRIVGNAMGSTTIVWDGNGPGDVDGIFAHRLEAVSVFDGGGIANLGTLTIDRSTISGNTAEDGGGLWNDGDTSVVNTTISGNFAAQEGGAVFNTATGVATFDSSTIVQNESLFVPGTQLDANFGDGSSVPEGGTTLLGLGTFVEKHDMLLQPDGSIVQVGFTTGGSSDFKVARLTPSGEIDTTFGDIAEHSLTIDFGHTDLAYQGALQDDGKIILAGASLGPGDDDGFALARVNPDGTLDNSFGSLGTVRTVVGEPMFGIAMALQDDGKILVAGRIGGAGSRDFAIARYTSSGALDPAFNGGSVLSIDFGDGGEAASNIDVLPDGRIVVSGSSGSLHAIAIIAADGNSLDATFGGDGKATIDHGVGAIPRQSIVVPGNKIVAVAETDIGISIVRLNSDGTTDTTFGVGGTTIVDLGLLPQTVGGVALAGDGSIYVTATIPIDEFGMDHDLAVFRLDANGAIDTSFGGTVHGTQGVFTTKVTDSEDRVEAIAVRPDGAVLIGGNSMNTEGNFVTQLLAPSGNGGVFNDSGSVASTDSIIANNVGGVPSDLHGEFTSNGGNLIGNVGAATGFDQTSDQVGTGISPLDPLLAPLADNGGPTLTHRPMLGSPAIDAGVGSLAVDQRGVARPVDGDGDGNAVVDAGAVELFFASAFGNVYEDVNANGVPDAGELGLQSWKIFVDENQNGRHDEGEQFTFSDADGNYAIDRIEPGTYDIIQELQPGWQQTFKPTVFEDNLQNGQADAVGATILGLAGLNDLIFSPNGQYLYGLAVDATASETHIVVFRRPSDTGRLEFLQDFVAFSSVVNASVQGSATGDSLFFQLDTGELLEAPIDQLTGLITGPPAPVSVATSTAGNDVLLTSDGKNVYSIGSGPGGMLHTVLFDPLFELPVIDDQGVSLAITPNEDFLFVNNGSGITTYSRNAAAGGSLTQVDPFRGIASDLTDMAVSPDGRHLYVLSRGDRTIEIFDIDPATAFLNYVDTLQQEMPDAEGVIVEGLDGAVRLAISPDGTRIYVTANSAAAGEDGLAVFERNPATGRLLFANALQQFGLDATNHFFLSLSNPGGLAVSHDGRDIYVASPTGGITHLVKDQEGQSSYTLAPGEHRQIFDFSNFAGPGEIRGTVFNDEDNDGFRDPTEDGLSGIEVYLDLDLSGDLSGGEPTATTDVLGSYTFDNLEAPRNYRVRLQLASGQEVTSPGAADGFERSIDLDPTEVFVGADFLVHVSLTGQSANSVINGVVFEDTSGDGVKQSGEAPLVGRRVYLDTNDNGVFDFGVDIEDLTDASGQYQFINLGATDFVVRVDTNPGETTTSPLGNSFAGLELPTGQNPLGLEAVDLDGQHGLDLISIDGGQDQVSVWLAQPGGGYGNRTTYQVGSLPTGMAVGHFNNDAHLDIAVVHFSLSQVVFLRGNGDGAFTPRQAADDVAVPSGFTTITTGDFDQNGTDDLAVAVDSGSFQDHTVRVLLNNNGATPNFTALPDVNIGRGAPVALAVGLFDAGTLPDLAVANFGEDNVQLLLNSGGGNLVAQPPVGVPGGPSSIAVADIDGNGTQDILGTSLETASVFQLLGNGAGSLTPVAPIPVGLGPRSLTLVDIDGDNDQDILVGREANDAVLLRSEPTGFALPETTGGSASFAQLFNSGVKQVVAMDFDGDGNRDVATVGGSSGSGLVEVFYSAVAPGSHRLRLNGSDAAIGRNFGLSLSAPGIPGDYDGSGTVDTADHAFWKTNFGATTGPGLAADGNNDGRVDAIDYAIWRENLGATSAASQSAVATATATSPPAIADAALAELGSGELVPALVAPSTGSQATKAAAIAGSSTLATQDSDAQLLLIHAVSMSNDDPDQTMGSSMQPTGADKEHSAWDNALESEFNRVFGLSDS